MSIIDSRRRIIQRFVDKINNLSVEGKTELEQQGHNASDKLIDSLESKVTNASFDSLTGVVLMEDYGQFVDSGTKPHFVPISALINWANIVRPSLSDKEKKNFAFAVRANIAKQGTPTSGSYAFSRNGRRKAFILEGIENKEPQDWAEELDLENELFKIIEAK